MDNQPEQHQMGQGRPDPERLAAALQIVDAIVGDSDLDPATIARHQAARAGLFDPQVDRDQAHATEPNRPA